MPSNENSNPTMKTKLLPIILAAVALCAGCATQYVSDDENNIGKPDRLTAPEKRRLASMALENLQIDPQFTRVYNKKKAALENKAAETGEEAELPLVAYDVIEDLTYRGGDASDVAKSKNLRGRSDSRMTRLLTDALSEELRMTGLFDVKDLFDTDRNIDILRKGEDEGGEAGGLDNYGFYHAPDILVSGRLEREKDDGIYTFSLRLSFADTATMRTFWSRTVRITKK